MLCAAFQTKTVGIVAALLQAGADIGAKNYRGASVLHRSAHNPNVEISAYLIEKGTQLEAVDDTGDTPLHCASLGNENPEIIELLLEAGADIEARNSRNMTPLLVAALQSKSAKCYHCSFGWGGKHGKEECLF